MFEKEFNIRVGGESGNILEAGRGWEGAREGGRDAGAARVKGSWEKVQNSNLIK